MTKMRVHELAKELGMENKELIDLLHKKNVEVSNHMSSIEDNIADEIRKEKNTRSEGKSEGEEAPKKKNLAFVIRPQNSKNSSRIQGKRPAQKSARPQQSARQNEAKAATTRPASQGARSEKSGAEKSQAARPVPAQTVKAETAAEHSTTEKRPGTQAQSAAEKPQGVRQEKQQPARAEKPVQVQSEKEKRTENDRPARENREARQSNDRPVRENRDGKPVRDGKPSDRQGRFDRGSNDRSRQERPQGNRQFGDGRQSRGGDRDRRPGGQNGRSDREKRESRRDDVAAPIVEQQKSQRNKAKDKERDNKKKEYRDEAFDGKGKKGKKQKQVAEVKRPQPKEEKKEEKIKQIVIPEVLTIKELADKMKIVPSVIVKKLFLQGKVVTVNQEIDYDTAEEIAMEFEVLCEKEEVVDVIEELLKEEEEDPKDLVPRPPVVCVMGHVDHGKTSLLDAIRETNVTSREAGGITQHIGAYVTEINGEKITFLDTPGHEAFTSMRMRGAQATDIAILVVAADDGVMPQTVEAINHAKAAGVQIIVAVNKIDKPSANVERVKQELVEYELIAEDWGGDTVFVPVSAHTGEGIDQLLEMIILTAEVEELKANPDRLARGVVIEAKLDKGRGPVATILVQKGTLHVGDNIAVGAAYGKIRAMMDDRGRRVKEALPSTPVEILGLHDVPDAGEIFMATENDKEARNIAETYVAQGREKLLDDTKAKLTLDGLFSQIQAGNIKELNIIVKADVQGSVEAVKQSLVKLSNEEVVVRVIHGGVGAINESDVSLAATSNAIIIGFNVRPDTTAKQLAEQEGVDLRLYKVIYQAIEDVEAAMKGMLDPVFEEKVIGHAEVRQLFKASGVGTIAGSYVLDGTFQRGCKVRITRGEEQIYEGELASLKRFKDDVKEVRAGYECGLVFQDFNDVKEEDKVEAYIMVEVPR